GQCARGPPFIRGGLGGLAGGTFGGGVGAAGAFSLPSFLLMLGVLPMVGRLHRGAWMRAGLRGTAPAVIGMTAVAVLRMLPAAVPDLLTAIMAVGTVVAMGLWHLSPLPLITGGAAIGVVLRARL